MLANLTFIDKNSKFDDNKDQIFIYCNYL